MTVTEPTGSTEIGTHRLHPLQRTTQPAVTHCVIEDGAHFDSLEAGSTGPYPSEDGCGYGCWSRRFHLANSIYLTEFPRRDMRLTAAAYDVGDWWIAKKQLGHRNPEVVAPGSHVNVTFKQPFARDLCFSPGIGGRAYGDSEIKR